VVEGGERPAAIPHIAALDGARGLAVAGVLLFHGGHLTGGYLGVDFFFTLSGFLITSLLLAESGRSGTVGLRAFWARRARRLLPALAVMMIGVAIYCWTAAAPDQLAQIRGEALATLAYVANWHQIFSHQSYFALFNAPSPLDHTWSLAIEEQFYVIWPLLFVGILARFGRATPKVLLATSLALAGASTALMIGLFEPANSTRAYFGTDTRATAILLGAALAAWFAMHGPVRGRAARIAIEVAGLTGAVVLAIAWTRLDGQSSTLYRGGFAVCALCSTAVIAAAVHPAPAVVSRALSFGPLCALGLISYGVYLYHWPIFVWLSADRTSLHGWSLFALQCALTLAVAIASFHLVERPIRRGWGSARVMLAAVPVAGLALVLAVVSATAAAPNFRVVTFARGVVPTVGSNAFRKEMSVLRGLAAEHASKPRILVFGDSTAFTLSYGAPGGIYEGRHMRGLATGLLGCSLLPYDRVDRGTVYKQDPKCNDWPAMLSAEVAAFRPAVVATMLGPWELYDRRTPSGPERVGSAALTADLEAQLARLQKIVVDGGARLVILTTPCFDPASAAPSVRPIVVRDRVAWVNRVWRDFSRSHHVARANLAGLLCPGGTPIEDRVGHRDRADGVHFSPAGAVMVWRWIDQNVAATSGADVLSSAGR
jgi:peptidoglycan/LPS O-acetylase OafA/YrhL